MTDPSQTPKTHDLVFEIYNPFEDFETARGVWLAMLDKSPHSFFTSWGWISTWLNSLPASSNVRLAAGFNKKEPVAALFVGGTTRLKRKFIPTRVISLNSTGDPYFDKLYIEYNSILTDPSYPFQEGDIFGFLERFQWDEFHLPGVCFDFISPPRVRTNRDVHLVLDEATEAHFVELEKIRAADMDYYKLLSANKRSQIRRSIREYERDGAVQIREAASVSEALEMLDTLAALHQRAWNKRNDPGAFANDYFRQFHRELVGSRFEKGEIQLLHIFTPTMTVGYLYNFIFDKRVMFYQSGLNYENANIHRPGLVSHFHAILHNAQKGMDAYDFMAGDDDYKKSLSTDARPMQWARLIKGRHRLWLEKTAARRGAMKISAPSQTSEERS